MRAQLRKNLSFSPKSESKETPMLWDDGTMKYASKHPKYAFSFLKNIF